MSFLDPTDAIPFARGTMAALPAGYSVEQLKAEQPTQSYEGFKSSIVAEAGRALNQPRGAASGDHSSYNYASGKLDYQPYERHINCDRNYLERVFLDVVFDRWLEEAILIGEVSAELADAVPQWRWPGTEHQDPQKESNAEATRLAANTTTLARIYSKQGLDWEQEVRQRAKEKALMRELGLTEAEVMPQDTEGDDAE